MIGTIVAVIFCALIVIACCASDSGSSNNSAPKTRPSRPQNNVYHSRNDYCECPSCGAPYYDGYCEECGYPDINQGWIGENY